MNKIRMFLALILVLLVFTGCDTLGSMAVRVGTDLVSQAASAALEWAVQSAVILVDAALKDLANYLFGVEKYTQGDYDGAITEFTTAINTLPPNDPKLAVLYNDRDLAYRAKGLNALAVADFEAALRIKPDYADARTNLATARQALASSSNPEIVNIPAHERPQLAILPFPGAGSDAESIAFLFSIQDALRTAFTIVPRSDAANAAIVADRSFQNSTSIDPEAVSRLGRMLGVDYVLSGYIRRLGDRNLFVAAIVRVETHELMSGGYSLYRGIEEIPALLPSITGSMAAIARQERSRLPKLTTADSRFGPGEAEAEVLAGLLPIAVANTGRFSVAPRTSNAGYVLSAEAMSMGSMNMLIVQILNAEDSSQLAGESLNYRAMDDGIAAMPQLASALAGRAMGPAAAVAQLPPQQPSAGASTQNPFANDKAQKAEDYKGGAFLLNMLLGFGIGSFVQGDTGGGVTGLLGDLLGIGLFIPGVVSEERLYEYYNDGRWRSYTVKNHLELAYAGIAVFGLSRLFQLIRPLYYASKFDVAFTPVIDNNGQPALAAAVHLRF